MNGLRGVTLTVRFLCELGLPAALAFWDSAPATGSGRGCWASGPPGW